MPADPNIPGGYTWVPKPGSEPPSYPCWKCGGVLEHLVVQPERSRYYMNDLLMCKDCKAILP